MSKFYFNHSSLINKEGFDIKDSLNELINMIGIIRKKGYTLNFSNRFWSIPISSGSLRSYLYSLSNQDKVRIIITSVMDLGPYYEEDPNFYPSLRVEPKIQGDTFGYCLLCVCFYDLQTLILSNREKAPLEHEQYFLDDGEASLEIKNIIGEEKLIEHIRYSEPFDKIEEVFERIEEDSQRIVILDSAKKSAKRHDFQKAYIAVYRTILALEETELLSLKKKEEQEESRKDNFFKTTGYEISGESQKTMRISKFRREREFNIPSSGKQLFEWHIKIGLKTRIHYYIDVEEDKVYIGHCGCHLGVSSYNS
ncbi:hypothetical protein JDS97_28515 [Bacillus cereus group sp. N18]|uniref:hypothetical protein n=1 Tax=Bacillus cereus group sp. N18 TaxID=2794590 RepID=UPI000872B72E|nr:hypothetical protein [Bacillus cereus group sp. N18]OFC92756.1 hypothetical protein BTGOE5_53800 [Bacillus thuringiensis]HDR7323222.1 hypothetical protein [Bacillus toyonensis]MBJ8050160.1 hypothetical protein [Bacillus cereus group sp. N18]OFD01778.1 hypothetical protein BTGOE7_55470 [Bacillus thuringiensis]HDR7440464.1 hypothetical protein [Bacillus toyonensis]